MELNSGTASYEGSMAQAIEQAFLEQWPGIMGSDPPDTSPQMKLLFLAVAEGVVRHLVANPQAFEIQFSGFDSGVNLRIEIKRT